MNPMPNQHAEDDINFWEGRQLNKFVKHSQIHEDTIVGHNGEEVVAATNATRSNNHQHMTQGAIVMCWLKGL
jgi:hypothetical protein